jgi:hypothetical protein
LAASFATRTRKLEIITFDVVPAGPYVTEGTLQAKLETVGWMLVKVTVRVPPESMLAVAEDNPPPQVAAWPEVTENPTKLETVKRSMNLFPDDGTPSM